MAETPVGGVTRLIVEITPRAQPVGLGRALRVPHFVQSIGAAKIAEVFAFPVEGRPWTGRVAEHEGVVVEIFALKPPLVTSVFLDQTRKTRNINMRIGQGGRST
jgi:hypothetical protein